MDLQLFSIGHAPPTLPIWETILEDLNRPSAEQIARVLDVGASTVYRWNQTGDAPKMACMSLFWLTRWGRSEVHTQATNDAVMAVSYARALREERNTLRCQLTNLTHERDNLRALVNRYAHQIAAMSTTVAVPVLQPTAAETGLLLMAREEGVDLRTEGQMGSSLEPVALAAGQRFEGTRHWSLHTGHGRGPKQATAPIQVLAEGDREQRIEGDAQALGVGLALGPEIVGEADVGSGHMPSIREWHQSGTSSSTITDLLELRQAQARSQTALSKPASTPAHAAGSPPGRARTADDMQPTDPANDAASRHGRAPAPSAASHGATAPYPARTPARQVPPASGRAPVAQSPRGPTDPFAQLVAAALGLPPALPTPPQP